MNDGSMRVVQVSAPVREQLMQNIRQGIMDARLRPGQRLVERELSEMTGVSRTSVREALRQLEAEGLVTNIPRKGTFVARPTRAETEELFDIREALEAIAARRFCEQASDEEVASLRRAVLDLGRASELGDLIRVKDEFYRILGSKTPILYDMMSTLHLRIVLLRSASLSIADRVAASSAELNAILDAIENRDSSAAAAAAAHHVRNAAAIALDNYGDDSAHAQLG